MIRRAVSLAALPAVLLAGAGAAWAAEPLLPDLIAWAKSPNYMYGGFFDTSLIANKVLYRFTGALANAGAGPLEVREVTHPDATQDIYQRVYDTDGGLTETLIASFPNANPTFGHLWLEGVAQYNLRTVTPGYGVGPIVASQDKTSMALVDGDDYNTSLPGAPSSPVYDSASDEILGISVGWADIYSWYIPGQWIDATGLADGQYWLEVVADPYARIQESDESNNATRIWVYLVVPEPTIWPGDYNQDGLVNGADYTVWRDTLGEEGVPLGTGADGDGNGLIDEPDFAVWRAHYGETAPSGTVAAGSAGAVPEPTSLVLGLTALWTCCRRCLGCHGLVTPPDAPPAAGPIP